jgi:ceramide glucosyltransferase
MILYWASVFAALLAVLGCGYLVGAMLLTHRLARTAFIRTGSAVGVTILKPLHGPEPGLFENLVSFCTQHYSGPVQIVFGVQDPRDDAIAIVDRLRAEHAGRRFDLVIDATMHGLNRKVSNLINMELRAEHEIIIVADSDMRVDPDYLSRVVTALEPGGVGAVTCLYHGWGATGLWSRIAALGINAHFLPSVVVGLGLGLAKPCFGSTIALKRSALHEIGGFRGVADCLADDYALGAALRGRGYQVWVTPFSIGHICTETSAAELWQHELRWSRTIRAVDPVGHAGSIVTHAFPFALIAVATGMAAASFGPATAIGLVVGALSCRLALLWRIERRFGLPRHAYWLIPLRDLLSVAVFLSSFFSHRARWKGIRYSFVSDGTLVATGGHQHHDAYTVSSSTVL